MNRTRRGVLAAGSAAAAATAVAALALTAWGAFLLQPRADEPVRADAVVMLAGADDGRHLYARDLVEAGYADTLLVSSPGGNSETVARRLCAGIARPAGAEVVWFSPDPRTPRGEAQTVASIARVVTDPGFCQPAPHPAREDVDAPRHRTGRAVGARRTVRPRDSAGSSGVAVRRID